MWQFKDSAGFQWSFLVGRVDERLRYSRNTYQGGMDNSDFGSDMTLLSPTGQQTVVLSPGY